MGVLIALWGSRLLLHQLSTRNNLVFLDLSIDGRMLLFTIAITALTALLFGIAPALLASGSDPIDSLKEHGRTPSGAQRARMSTGLVISQVALSLVLVVAAGLFVHTFASLATRHLSFESDRVLLVNVNSQRATVDPTRRVQMYEELRDAVRALPGVTEAALSLETPVSGGGTVPRFEVSGGVPLAENEFHANGFANIVSPGYFATLGTPIVAGRDFDSGDRTGTQPVVIVNETVARAALNGASPLGHTITVHLGPAMSMQVVGMVADAVYRTLRDPVPPTIYMPLAQFPVPPPRLALINLSVRSASGSPQLLTRSVAATIGTVNPQLALTFRPLAEQVNASLTQERVVAMLSGFFGGLALLLAGLGLYGVTAYAVTQRRTEIGIRIALGAAPAAVVRLVLARVSMLVGVGVLVGTGLSAWASKFIATLLYGLAPRDPVTLVGASALLVTIGGLAGWLPAWRASRIDPAETLREN